MFHFIRYFFYFAWCFFLSHCALNTPNMFYIIQIRNKQKNARLQSEKSNNNKKFHSYCDLLLIAIVGGFCVIALLTFTKGSLALRIMLSFFFFFLIHFLILLLAFCHSKYIVHALSLSLCGSFNVLLQLFSYTQRIYFLFAFYTQSLTCFCSNCWFWQFDSLCRCSCCCCCCYCYCLAICHWMLQIFLLLLYRATLFRSYDDDYGEKWLYNNMCGKYKKNKK